MRGNFFNTVLESNFGGIKFFINRLQHEAIMDFEQTKEGADGKKDKKSVRDASTGVSFQEYGHITDATDYLLCNAFANDYIAYQKGGVNTKMSLVNLPSRHSY